MPSDDLNSSTIDVSPSADMAFEVLVTRDLYLVGNVGQTAGEE